MLRFVPYSSIFSYLLSPLSFRGFRIDRALRSILRVRFVWLGRHNGDL